MARPRTFDEGRGGGLASHLRAGCPFERSVRRVECKPSAFFGRRDEAAGIPVEFLLLDFELIGAKSTAKAHGNGPKRLDLPRPSLTTLSKD